MSGRDKRTEFKGRAGREVELLVKRGISSGGLNPNMQDARVCVCVCVCVCVNRPSRTIWVLHSACSAFRQQRDHRRSVRGFPALPHGLQLLSPTQQPLTTSTEAVGSVDRHVPKGKTHALFESLVLKNKARYRTSNFPLLMCFQDNILDKYLLSSITTSKFSITYMAGIISLIDSARPERG